MELEFQLLFTFRDSFDALSNFWSVNSMMRDMEEGGAVKGEWNVAAQSCDNY